jgi:similar to stage IV sporulation protein
LNLAAKNRIGIWGAKKKGETMTAFTSAADYKSLSAIAGVSGTSLKADGRHGLPFITKRYSRRTGVLAGALVLALTLYFMTKFIWSVNITGNSALSQEEIAAELDSLGLKIGAYIDSIDFDEIQQKALIDLDELSWMGISLDGTTVLIEVRERGELPEIIDKDEACNIIAAKTGLIKSMKVFSGRAEVSAGDAVLKGQLLVNSIYTDKNGKSALNHARAEIIALIEEDKTFEVNLSGYLKDFTGVEKDLLIIDLFGYKIPLGSGRVPYERYETKSRRKDLVILGKTLPLALISEQYREYSSKPFELTPEEAEEKTASLVLEYESAELSQAIILRRDFTKKQANGKYITNAHYLYETDIAREQPILAEQIKILEALGIYINK